MKLAVAGGGECELPAIRGPNRLGVCGGVVCDLGDVGAVWANGVDVPVAISVAGECNR